MADMIIEQWGLSVLRVALDLTDREPRVRCTLVTHKQGNPRVLWQRDEELAGFGLAELAPGTAPTELEVPAGLRDALLASLKVELSGQSALWLRLIPPSGFLGAVPWERALLPEAGVPFLRVPDRMPVASNRGAAWSVAVLVSAQAGAQWGARHVADLVAALHGTWQEHDLTPLAIDVFADAGTAAGLGAWGPDGPELADGPRVRIHTPPRADPGRRRAGAQGARDRGQGDAGALDGWSAWIREGLAGRTVRALHVATPATLDGDVPWLSLSPDPAAPSDWSSCGYTSTDPLRTLADQLGASLLIVGSPPGNPSDIATRLLVDSAGLTRPGPTVYADLGGGRAQPGDAEPALAQLHALMATLGRSDRVAVPQAADLFAYLQPAQIAAKLVEAPPPKRGPGEVPDSLLEVSEVTSLQDGDESIPDWVATSERFVESEVAVLVHSAAPEAAVATKASHDRGAAAALEDVRAMIARHAGQP